MRKPILKLIGSSNFCYQSESIAIIIGMDSFVFLNGADHCLSLS